MPLITTARRLPPQLEAQLASLGDWQVYDADHHHSSLQDAKVWLGTTSDPMPAEFIATLPDSVGLIANLGVGIDNIDLVAARTAGIAVSNTPVVTGDTADLTMALMLATCRRVGEGERALRAGDWETGNTMLGTRVHGKTLGIVGFGNIGQAVARRARGFDMKVLYHGPTRKVDAEIQTGASYSESLEVLLAEADIVSLHCPLSTTTRHLINRETLGHMRREAILINVGRGPLVDEAALVEALQANALGGAGLDVYEFQPEVTPALKEFARVVLLPYIGSATTECRRDMALRGLANIRAFLSTGKPLDDCHSGRQAA